VVMLFPGGALQFNPEWEPARPIRWGEEMAKFACEADPTAVR